MKAKGLLLPGLTVGALLFIDANYLSALNASGLFLQATWLELLIFGLQPAKTIGILAFRRTREAPPSILIDVYGAELLFLPILAVASLLLGVAALPSLIMQLLGGWIVGVSLAAPALAAYKVGASMLRSESLTRVIPLALLASEASVLFLNAANGGGTGGGVIASIARNAIRSYESVGVTSPGIYADLALVYLLMLLYAIVGWEASHRALTPRPLLVGIAATGAAAALTLGLSAFALPLQYLLVPPTFAVVGATWVVGHGS